MIKIAESYLNVNISQKQEMLNYYNEKVLPEVPSTKRYKMTASAPWCGMFVSVAAHKAGYRGRDFPFGVSVKEMVKQAFDDNAYFERSGLNSMNGVTTGDLAVFDWFNDGSFDHIGIVTGVHNDNITTIEGNVNNTVTYRSFKKNSSFFKGFICVGSSHGQTCARVINLVKRTIRGDFGSGSTREHLLGVDYEEVQKRINEIFKMK